MSWEVRTMKSKTSFFNWTLFRRNLLRTMPLWIIYTLVLFIVLPLNHMDGNYSWSVFASEYREAALIMGNLVHPVYGVILAAVFFGYLNKTRSAYMLHAFPVTRSSLFVTNWCSGLAVMLAPQLFVTGAALLLCSGAYRGGGVAAILLSLGLMVLQYLFFYGLAVFCMQLTGKTSAGVLTALVLNVLVWALESLTRATVRPLLYGIPTGESVLWFLSPFMDFFGNSIFDYTAGDAVIYYGILGAVGLGLTLLGWLLYRKRHMERAGDVVAFRFARPIFKYLFTYLITMVLGWLLCLLLLGGDYSRSDMLLMGLLLGIACIIGCFVGEMLLKRTVKVFTGKQLLSCFCCLLVLWGGMAALYFDVFGIIRRVPGLDQVAAVSLELDRWAGHPVRIEDPEDVQLALDYHQAMLEPSHWEDSDSSITLTYELKNGGTLTRCYARNSSPLFTDPSVVRAYYEGLHWSERVQVTELQGDWTTHYLTREQRDTLKELLLEDADSGRVNLTALPDGDGCAYEVLFDAVYYHSFYVSRSSSPLAAAYLDSLFQK